MIKAATRHVKIPGVVERLGDPWMARIPYDGGTAFVEIADLYPPPDIEVGMLFTIHKPRRGKPYFYWIRKPMVTKRWIKKFRIEARRLLGALEPDRS